MDEIPGTPVTRLDESDAERLHDLLTTSWRETYTGLLPADLIRDAEDVWHSTETLRRQMKNRTVLFAGCKRDGRMLGMIRGAMVDTSTLRVFQLYVRASEQGKGIGTELLRYARASFPDARKLVVDVTKGNEKGLRFFERYGFTFVSESTLKLGSSEVRNLVGTMDV